MEILKISLAIIMMLIGSYEMQKSADQKNLVRFFYACYLIFLGIINIT